MTTLRQAAQAVIERWDAPDLPEWHNQPSTALCLTVLREALEVPEQEPVAWMTEDGRISTAVTVNEVMHTVVKASFCIPLYTAAPVAAPDIKALQANGKGPAPCARFCEANAFQNAIRQAERERDEMRNKYLQGVELANSFAQLTVDLTKERDEYRLFADAMAAAHKVERDALLLANLDLSSWFDALKADHDALKAAGKIARTVLSDALDYVSCEAWSPSMDAECRRALTALRSTVVV